MEEEVTIFFTNKEEQYYHRQLCVYYEEFHETFKEMHKLSDRRKDEPVAQYYFRWRENMRREIHRLETKIINSLSI